MRAPKEMLQRLYALMELLHGSLDRVYEEQFQTGPKTDHSRSNLVCRGPTKFQEDT